MDTTGKYPKLGNADPLFEMADYTQQMSAALNPVAAGVTFNNGWVNFGGTYNVMKTKEIVGGVVLLVGMIKPGTLSDGIQVATIPIQHRPNVATYMPCILRAGSVNRPGMMSVAASGPVYVFGDMTSVSYVVFSNTYNLSGG